MQIKVRYFNILQEALNQKEEYFESEESLTISGLAFLIVQKHGSKAEKLLYGEDEKLAPYIRIFVDNKMIHNPEFKLSHNNEVSLFFAVVGG